MKLTFKDTRGRWGLYVHAISKRKSRANIFKVRCAIRVNIHVHMALILIQVFYSIILELYKGFFRLLWHNYDYLV
jgi:hypothetical protein